jgi:hypothetical protein
LELDARRRDRKGLDTGSAVIDAETDLAESHYLLLVEASETWESAVTFARRCGRCLGEAVVAEGAVEAVSR